MGSIWVPAKKGKLPDDNEKFNQSNCHSLGVVNQPARLRPHLFVLLEQCMHGETQFMRVIRLKLTAIMLRYANGIDVTVHQLQASLSDSLGGHKGPEKP